MSSTISSIHASAWRDRLVYIRSQMRRYPLVAIGAVIAAFWVLIVFTAPLVASHDPYKQNVTNRLQSPGNNGYLWGSDELGRDIYTRVLYGTSITVPAGLAVILIGGVIGIMIGAVAGYVGGLWDEIIMRVTELFMAFPTIILAMAVTAALGPNIRNAILALVIVWWPGYARLLRGIVLEIKNNEYVEAARSAGAKGSYILLRTILPNAIAPAVILMTLDIAGAILAFAGLSFLGLGPEPTSPEWGRMVAVGIDYFDQWWMWLFPGLAIASLVMAFNFIGDGVRDITDPRMR